MENQGYLERRIIQGREAGYPQEQIDEWIRGRIKKAKEKGYSDEQIQESLGVYRLNKIVQDKKIVDPITNHHRKRMPFIKRKVQDLKSWAVGEESQIYDFFKEGFGQSSTNLVLQYHTKGERGYDWRKAYANELTDDGAIERLFRNIYLSKFSYSGNRQSYWGEQESERKKGQKHGEVIKRNAERLIAKLKKTHILNMDFRNVIQRYDSPTTLFYLDPPYSQKISRWGYNVPHVSPEDVYNAVKNIKGKFILSYDNSPEIRKVFKSFFIKKIKTTYELSGTRQPDVTELLISNFKLK